MNCLADYVAFWNSLSSTGLEQMERLVAPTIRFKDPFNDVIGLQAFEAVLRHAMSTLDEIRFDAHHEAWDGQQGFLHWTMTAKIKRSHQPISITGVSLVRLDEQGRVQEHIDHWDAAEQFYEKIPVLGMALRTIKSKIAVE